MISALLSPPLAAFELPAKVKDNLSYGILDNRRGGGGVRNLRSVGHGFSLHRGRDGFGLCDHRRGGIRRTP